MLRGQRQSTCESERPPSRLQHPRWCKATAGRAPGHPHCGEPTPKALPTARTQDQRWPTKVTPPAPLCHLPTHPLETALRRGHQASQDVLGSWSRGFLGGRLVNWPQCQPLQSILPQPRARLSSGLSPPIFLRCLDSQDLLPQLSILVTVAKRQCGVFPHPVQLVEVLPPDLFKIIYKPKIACLEYQML